MTDIYPQAARERDRWILSRRPARNVVDPRTPFAFVLEEERAESGEVVRVATIFLTNRECPWRCVMCDLWRTTLAETVPAGAIPAQIDYALDRLSASARQIKLYNSGSFFDPRAIPPEDHPAIVRRVRPFDRVIVECHPALVNERAIRFRDQLVAENPTASLEVAMGLETAHPQVLEKLNKRMTLEDFARAAEFLCRNDIALRVFVLVKPPFLVDEAEALHWAERSIAFGFECGATVVSVIPTRFGNGALEALAAQGEFAPPELSTLEATLCYGMNLRRGRVFADLWDLGKFSTCPACFDERRQRLHTMNVRQEILPVVECVNCAGQSPRAHAPSRTP